MRKKQWLKRSNLLLYSTIIMSSVSLNAASKENYTYKAEKAPQVITQQQFELSKSLMIDMDTYYNIPNFMWATKGAGESIVKPGMSDEQAARLHLTNVRKKYGMSVLDINNAYVHRSHNLGSGAIIITLRQKVSGIDVYGQNMSVIMDQQHNLVAVSGHLQAGLNATSTMKPHVLSNKVVALKAFEDLTDTQLDPSFARLEKSKHGYAYISYPSNQMPVGLSLSRDLRIKPVYVPMQSNIEPAFYIEVWTNVAGTHSGEAFSYLISATDGKILKRSNLSANESFKYRVWVDADTGVPMDSPFGNDFSPTPVYDENNLILPEYVDSTLITVDGRNKHGDSWLPDGATVLTGNHGDAYADISGENGFDADDIRPTVTAAGEFDRIYDVTMDPQANQAQSMAAVTDMFYVANYLHDIYYDFGFDEAAGNGQLDNLGRGGKDGDSLNLQGQDFGGFDNANMSTPEDGESPQMQMYLFPSTLDSVMHIQGSNADFNVHPSSFGALIREDLSLDLIRAEDGSTGEDGMGTTFDACEPLTSNVMGKTAIVDRGNCNFTIKVKNAQDAGAVAVLIHNNNTIDPDEAFGGSGDDETITIPSMMVSYNNAQIINAALSNNGGNLTATVDVTVMRDGTLDNQVIAHEWGHYMFGRLVGGGFGAGNRQGSGINEGNSDFVAMLMTLRESDLQVSGNEEYAGAYAAAVFVGGPFSDNKISYLGFRRFPYSPNPEINPLVFDHIQNNYVIPEVTGAFEIFGENAEVHNVGEVWSEMLWECYVALLNQHGFTQAKSRMQSYLVASLKAMPASPTFTEVRNAVLAVALANDAADFELMWEKFARRGLGVLAKSSSRFSTDHRDLESAYQVGGHLSLSGFELVESDENCDSDGILDQDEEGLLRFTLTNDGSVDLAGSEINLESFRPETLSFLDDATIDVPMLTRFESKDFELRIRLNTSTDRLLVKPRITAYNAEAIGSAALLEQELVVNYDEAASSSMLADMESLNSSFAKTFDGEELFESWDIAEETLYKHYWHGPDQDGVSQTVLVTPVFEVSAAEDFHFKFKHRYSFEFSAEEVPSEVEGEDPTIEYTYFDTGLIEISSDNGATWRDVSDFVEPGYTGQTANIVDLFETPEELKNPLADRMAFTALSEDYPKMKDIDLNFGTQFSGQSVQIRFNIGTDIGDGASGWDIDNIEVLGTENTPFYSLSVENNICDGDVVTDAGDMTTAENLAPIAKVDAYAESNSEKLVNIDGTESYDPEGKHLTYKWTQIHGDTVTLSNPENGILSFTAPKVKKATLLKFSLVVNDGEQDSIAAIADLLVWPKKISEGESPDLGDEGCSSTGKTPSLFALLFGLLLLPLRRKKIL